MLPDVVAAPLPESYEQARAALATCMKLDECKGWADKAAAMASYAKQAGDKTLFNLAAKIKARAVRRLGELLKEVPPGKGGRPTEEKPVPAAAQVSRSRAAQEAGLSTRQKVTALRVANVPEAAFEAAVEAEPPSTITRLAKQGTKPAPSRARDMKSDPRVVLEEQGLEGWVQWIAAQVETYFTSADGAGKRLDVLLDLGLGNVDPDVRKRLGRALAQLRERIAAYEVQFLADLPGDEVAMPWHAGEGAGR